MVPIKVEIAKTDSGYQLLRGGQPYVIKGAGMGEDDIERFAAHGGNSIRTWSTDNDAQDTLKLLDAAYKHGVTVALCLAMQTERWGFDYNDDDAVAAQLAEFRHEVSKYKDHPALLFWIVGNELNHGYTNGKVYDAVSDVVDMIHELDPNHPVTTTIAGLSPAVVRDVEARAPNLDFLSFQLYGDLFVLPQLVKDAGVEQPFMVTEWGAIGYWEVETTAWQAPIEANSTEKAATFRRGMQDVLDSMGGQLIGSYAFLWGQKQERTPTWFGMFTEDGRETEVVDVMHFLWTGSWPASRSPRVNSVEIAGQSFADGATILAGETIRASADIVDPNDGALSFRWELKQKVPQPRAVVTTRSQSRISPASSTILMRRQLNLPRHRPASIACSSMRAATTVKRRMPMYRYA